MDFHCHHYIVDSRHFRACRRDLQWPSMYRYGCRAPSLPDQARVISRLATRLTGAALPLGQDRAAAAALAFYVGYMKDLPQDQMQMTEGSAYMDEVACLRDELIGRNPALEEILESPVQSRLLAWITHVVDDNTAVRLLWSCAMTPTPRFRSRV